MADERPAKIRKLSHSDEQGEVETESGASDSPEILVEDAAEGEGEEGAQMGSKPSVPGSQELPDAQSEAGEAKPMSKNQLKKQRKRQEWEAGRDYRKQKRKQKAKEKKVRKRAAWEESKVNGEEVVQPTSRKPRNPVKLPVTFIIDCGFDDLMVEKEMISLGSQVTRSYSDNARSNYQAHLVVSSWSGKLKERFDTVLNGHYKNWRGMKFMEEDFVEVAEKAKEWMAVPKENKMAGVFAKYVSQQSQQNDQTSNARPDPSTDEPNGSSEELQQSPPAADQEPEQRNGTARAQEPESAQPDPQPTAPPTTNASTPPPISPQAPQGEIIYLSSDSPYTLEELQPHSTYIIGGLVDKNRHKGICQKIATEKGLRTAKLPISEFMEMQSRSVLATNHVNEIMLRWLECGDWGRAFMQVIPKRKGGRLRGEAEVGVEAEAGSSDQDDEEDAELGAVGGVGEDRDGVDGAGTGV